MRYWIGVGIKGVLDVLLFGGIFKHLHIGVHI
jgi:hypothetical protein